jgi:transcription-repair coupling factor (superfamily II helicase)
VQSLARRLEHGGALPCAGIARPHSRFSPRCSKTFPQRPIVVVTENLKTQESFQQDLETWLGSSPLFYPAWEVLPHEGKLPHADVISDRLQTLVALNKFKGSKFQAPKLIVTSVTALLQKTFAPDDLKNRTRHLRAATKSRRST